MSDNHETPTIGRRSKPKPKLMIYDIDGVVADSQTRYDRSGAAEAKDYVEFRASMKRYAEDIYDDEPIHYGIEMIDHMRKLFKPHRMLALTARGEDGREWTRAWLREHVLWEVKDEDLIMRPSYVQGAPGMFMNGGHLKFDPIEFKRRIALELMNDYKVVMAFDDHQEIAEAYWKIGIPSVCVLAPGVDHYNRLDKKGKSAMVEK